MGFLGKTKNSIFERFGDEVVRKGTFGGSEEEEALEEAKEPKPVKPKPVKTKAPKPTRQPKPKRAPKPKLPREPKVKLIKPKPVEEPEEFQDDAFESFEDQQSESLSFTEKEPESSLINKQDLTKLSKDEGQTVEEVLKSMKIEETFTINDGILFLDEDLANQDFATQAPYGYDMGEVDFFLSKTQRSVAEYVKLLRIRNDDVVKMARRISDMMVEINNIRFNSEVANGINIMASGGDDDGLAVDLREAKARSARLQEELDNLKASGVAKTVDEDELSQLKDDLSAERIENSRLEKEVKDMRAHLVMLEEEYDIQVISDQGELEAPSQSGYDSYEEERQDRFQSVEGWDTKAEDELYAEEDKYKKVGRDHWLPGLEEEAEEGLPVITESSVEETLPEYDDEETDNEQSLSEISLNSFNTTDNGGFEQTDSKFEDSAFTANPYQNLDEFIENNIDGFPEDNKSIEDPDEDDPDEDGFKYSFEKM